MADAAVGLPNSTKRQIAAVVAVIENFRILMFQCPPGFFVADL
jgi:hypothetical protein